MSTDQAPSAADRGSALSEGLGAGAGAPWVCPWGICGHHDAQHCRADKQPGQGCGSRFSDTMTPEEARAQITPRVRVYTQEELDAALAGQRLRCASACEHFATGYPDHKVREALLDVAALMRRMRA